MTKVTNSRPPVWAEQLIKDVADLKEFVVEQKAFNARQEAFNAQVFEFMKEQREFNKLLLSLPTIKREIAEIRNK